MDIGFIILRHVRCSISKQYWKLCYEHIRRYYSDSPIVIIDDASDDSLIDHSYEKEHLTNTTIHSSIYIRRGELLPYLYYLEHPFCKQAVFLHDSVFLNSEIDFQLSEDEPYRSLWSFTHYSDNPHIEKPIIEKLSNSVELLSLYDRIEQWDGCFGVMCTIRHEYLLQLHHRYGLYNLIPYIKTRDDRMALERIMACILECPIKRKPKSFLGHIGDYCKWGIELSEYEMYRHLPVIKVWSGR